MEAEQSITEQLSTSLQARWEKYNQELNRCRAEFSEEAVHDLRVATRRLLALLDLTGLLYTGAPVQKLLLAFKDQLDSYDDLRDTQVMLLEVGQQVQEMPSLATFQKFLAKREKRLLQAAQKNVQSYKLNTLEKRLTAVQKAMRKTAEDSALAESLFQTLDDVYASVLKRFKQIDPAIPQTIHRVRVRFKKFRYMIECVYPFIADFPPDNLRAMHDYQTLMGNIQDVEVLLSTLNTLAAKKNGHNFSEAIEHYQNRHTQTIQAYLGKKDELFQFWRASPSKPFPWQATTASQTGKKPRRKAGVPSAKGAEEEIKVAQEA